MTQARMQVLRLGEVNAF